MIPALIIFAVLIIAYCIIFSMMNASGAADDRAFVPEELVFLPEEYNNAMACRDFDRAQKALEEQFHRGSVPYSDVQQQGLDATQETEPVNKA
jgi:hypothetical protein